MITSEHSLSDEEIPFSHMLDIEIDGVAIRCLRLTFMGELGFELHVPRSESTKIYKLLRSHGDELEKETGLPVRDAGYRAIDSLSAEKGFRHWHADLTGRDTPLEAGIGFTVLKKLKRTGPDAPDFIGR
jgi:sarcosine dehydrogenase